MAGLSKIGRENALAAVLSNSTNVYIALLTTYPTDQTGAGLVEATGSGYARLAHMAWSTATTLEDTTRSNSSAITFAALTGDLSGVVGWAIYDALTLGNLLAFGRLVNSSDEPISVDFVNTDQPRFAIGELEVTIRTLV